MFKDAIPGMDKVFQSEPPAGSVILVVGSAGTLKSAFVYNMVANHMARRPNDSSQCVYVTLEETRESLLRNIQNMGIPVSERIQVADLASFLRAVDLWKDHLAQAADYITLILQEASRPFKIPTNLRVDKAKVENTASEKEGAAAYKGPTAVKPSIFVLDSLNAFNTLVYQGSTNIRQEMASFMFNLREKVATSFIVMEVGDPSQYKSEHFLVDGIIELGMKQTEHSKLKRYLKVRKMRSTKHSIEPFLIEVTGEGIKVVEELI